jgi:CRISPR-associated protein Csb2
MALSIVVRLRFGRYDAAGVRPSVPEWPPHPARVFCALVASGYEDADWDALGWLERAGMPQVWSSGLGRVTAATAAGYVVNNSVERSRGSLAWPGRTNGYRRRMSVFPSDDGFALVWPDVNAGDGVLGRLVRLASRVPYVGRSSSSAEVSVLPRLPEQRPQWTVHRLVPIGTPGSVPLRVPYPGYLDRLRAAYDDGDRAWEVSRSVAYLAVGEDVEPDREPVPVVGPYRDLLVWQIARPSVPVAGDRTLTVTEALRQAVISRVADPVPAVVSGHGADGRSHVAYLGLPHVGYERADGHLLGVAVAVPADIDPADRRALLHGLLDESDRLVRLRIGARQELALEYRPDALRPYGATPERWTRPATRWATATPVMLDRHPRRSFGTAEAVAAAVATAGYPEPVDVSVSPAPPLAGGVRQPRPGTWPARRPNRPLVHCRMEFAVPVRGPVLAGSLRYLGWGLFVPESKNDTDDR